MSRNASLVFFSGRVASFVGNKSSGIVSGAVVTSGLRDLIPTVNLVCRETIPVEMRITARANRTEHYNAVIMVSGRRINLNNQQFVHLLSINSPPLDRLFGNVVENVGNQTDAIGSPPRFYVREFHWRQRRNKVYAYRQENLTRYLYIAHIYLFMIRIMIIISSGRGPSGDPGSLHRHWPLWRPPSIENSRRFSRNAFRYVRVSMTFSCTVYFVNIPKWGPAELARQIYGLWKKGWRSWIGCPFLSPNDGAGAIIIIDSILCARSFGLFVYVLYSDLNVNAGSLATWVQRK